MKPSLNSPKNKYRASITYSKPLSEIGSVSTAMGMTLEAVKKAIEFYTNQATRNGAASSVVIYQNLKSYPDFDWVEVERFSVNEKRGGARVNAGNKPKYDEETKTVAFRVPLSKENEVKEMVKNYLESLKQ